MSLSEFTVEIGKPTNSTFGQYKVHVDIRRG